MARRAFQLSPVAQTQYARVLASLAKLEKPETRVEGIRELQVIVASKSEDAQMVFINTLLSSEYVEFSKVAWPFVEIEAAAKGGSAFAQNLCVAIVCERPEYVDPPLNPVDCVVRIQSYIELGWEAALKVREKFGRPS